VALAALFFFAGFLFFSGGGPIAAFWPAFSVFALYVWSSRLFLLFMFLFFLQVGRNELVG
jgi:hypothetical protein